MGAAQRGVAIRGQASTLSFSPPVCFSPSLTLLEPHFRFGDKPLKFQVVCPQIGTAVLKGLTPTNYFNNNNQAGGKNGPVDCVRARLSSSRTRLAVAQFHARWRKRESARLARSERANVEYIGDDIHCVWWLVVEERQQ